MLRQQALKDVGKNVGLVVDDVRKLHLSLGPCSGQKRLCSSQWPVIGGFVLYQQSPVRCKNRYAFALEVAVMRYKHESFASAKLDQDKIVKIRISRSVRVY